MRPFFYARFRRDLLSVRLVGTDLQWEDTPDVAIDRREARVLAVGQAAQALAGSHVRRDNGFHSPRTIVGDVDLAEIALLHAVEQIRRAYRRRLWHPLLERRPDLLLHPLVEPEGGLNSFELRGLESHGKAVHARKTFVWVGPELSDREIRAGIFRPRLLRD